MKETKTGKLYNQQTTEADVTELELRCLRMKRETDELIRQCKERKFTVVPSPFFIFNLSPLIKLHHSEPQATPLDEEPIP
jgi:hypothetical protein